MGSHCDCLHHQTIYINNKQSILDKNNSTTNKAASPRQSLFFSDTSFFSLSKPYINNEECFGETLLGEFNIARASPKQYASKLKTMLNHIQIENQTCILQYKEEKIILQKGTQVFLDAISILNQMKPIGKLVYNENIVINCEQLTYQSKGSKNRINNRVFNKSLQQVMLEKRNDLLKTYSNCLFTLDIFKDPVISAMFQITDEAFNQTRRNIILNPNFTQLGVGCFYDNNNKFMVICSFV